MLKTLDLFTIDKQWSPGMFGHFQVCFSPLKKRRFKNNALKAGGLYKSIFSLSRENTMSKMQLRDKSEPTKKSKQSTV